MIKTELDSVILNEASKPAEEINVSYLKSVLEGIHEDGLSQTEKERLQQLFQEIRYNKLRKNKKI